MWQHGLPDSQGSRRAAKYDYVPYNDQKLKEAFEKFGNDIAAVIMEPVAGNKGFVPP